MNTLYVRKTIPALALGVLLLAATSLALHVQWTPQPALAATPREDQPDGSTISPVQGINGTWGPGVVTAATDVVISPGVVITVAPHTTILVADSAAITVYGNLHADGPVTFTTATSPTTPGAWEGIVYAPGSSGYLDQATVEYAGHAVILNTANPITISNCILRHNRHAPPPGQDAFGAGLAIISGTHLVTHTEVYGNILVATGTGGDAFGGGIDIQGAGSRVINSAVYANEITSTLGFAVGGGIAIRGDGNASLIEGCRVTTNTLHALGVDGVATYGEGSGIGIPENSDTHAVVRESLIAGNVNRSVAASGGGIGLAGGAAAALIEGNVIYDNLCESPGGTPSTMNNYWAEGGGIDTWNQNVVTVTNNLILSNTVRCVGRCYENTGPTGGGMMVNGRSVTSPTRVINNTVVGNRAEGQTSGGYGGGFGAQTYGVYANNVVAGNRCTASNCGGAFYWWGGVSVDYSLLWGNSPGDYGGSARPGTTHDVSADPLFADTGPWGHHLSLASPARDAGTCTDAPADDFEDDARPLGRGCDIGWDETGYLEFSKHTDRTTASPDLPIQYTIRVTNTDLHVAAAVVVTDPLDADLHWISGGSESGGVVILTSTVPPGGAVELSFVAAANRGVPDGTVVTNTAYISDGRYLSPTNPVTTTIYSPVLTVTKEAAGVVVGTPLTYTLHVSNTGAGLATNVVVTDAVPPNAAYLSGGTESGGVVTWTIPSIGPGTTAEVTFTIRTCQESLTNAHYTVVTSTQGIASLPGAVLTTALTPPTVVASFDHGPSTPLAGEAVAFTSTSSTDGGPLVAWSWDLGDGGGSGESVTHTYGAPGVYTVTLVVTDTCGYTATTATPIEVYALLNINTVGNGSVTADPAKAYYSGGDVVTLTATAAPGWVFTGWSGDLTGDDNPAVVIMDGDKAVVATFSRRKTYLPLVLNGYEPRPDLVVHSLEVVTSTAEATATVVVKNVGSRPAGPFWVELYVDPANPPAGPNQPWQTRGCAYGVVWQVTSGLEAGESITLTTAPGHGERSPVPSQTDWPSPLPPGRHTFYAYADSWGGDPARGAVLEENEGNNRFGPVQ